MVWPCKQIGPTLEELSDDKDGDIVVAKLNIDDNPMTPSKYGVRGIPTLLLFKDGQVASMKVGSLPKSQIYDWVDSRSLGNGFTRKRKPRQPAGFFEACNGGQSRQARAWRIFSMIWRPVSSYMKDSRT